MTKIITATIAAIAFATSAFAAPEPLFDRYEAVRRALLNGVMTDIQSTARDLGSAASSLKLEVLATHANQLANARNIKAARAGFAVVSEDVIIYRNSGSTSGRPVVVYCSMEKKSWLQPSTLPITNPYVDGSMRSCGQIVK